MMKQKEYSAPYSPAHGHLFQMQNDLPKICI